MLILCTLRPWDSAKERIFFGRHPLRHGQEKLSLQIALTNESPRGSTFIVGAGIVLICNTPNTVTRFSFSVHYKKHLELWRSVQIISVFAK